MNCSHSEPENTLDCAECQSLLALSARLGSRLAPPPSPLGADWARRTAEAVLQRAQSEPPPPDLKNRLPGQSPWRSVHSNPLVHIVRRERTRRMFRLPGLAAVLLLYALPGWLFNFAGGEEQWAYMGVVRLGLTVVLPLFLLAAESASLSSLVRGRCLEEMLHAGMPPGLLTDTLAFNGLRALLPVLALIGLVLAPLQGGGSMLAWCGSAAAVFACVSYLTQAALLVPQRATRIAAVGLPLAVGSLAGTPALAVGCLATLSLCAVQARRDSQLRLAGIDQGKAPAARKRRTPWHSLVLSRLPNSAVLRREVQRHPELPLAPLGLAAAALAAAAAWWSPGSVSPLLVLAGLCAVAAWEGQSLLVREKTSGTFEVLAHSNLDRRDWLQAAGWLSVLRWWPLVLVTSLCALSGTGGTDTWLPGAAVGTALSLTAALWSGSRLGVGSGWRCASQRSALGQTARQLGVSAVTCLVVLKVAFSLRDLLLQWHSRDYPVVSETLDASLGALLNSPELLAVPLVALFTWWCARRAVGDDVTSSARDGNLWAAASALGFPLVIFLDLLVESHNSQTVRLTALPCLWAGLAFWLSAPLRPVSVYAGWRQPRSWVLPLLLPCLIWLACCVTFWTTRNSDWLASAPTMTDGLAHWLPACLGWAVLLVLVAERAGWQAPASPVDRGAALRRWACAALLLAAPAWAQLRNWQLVESWQRGTPDIASWPPASRYLRLSDGRRVFLQDSPQNIKFHNSVSPFTLGQLQYFDSSLDSNLVASSLSRGPVSASLPPFSPEAFAELQRLRPRLTALAYEVATNADVAACGEQVINLLDRALHCFWREALRRGDQTRAVAAWREHVRFDRALVERQQVVWQVRATVNLFHRWQEALLMLRQNHLNAQDRSLIAHELEQTRPDLVDRQVVEESLQYRLPKRGWGGQEEATRLTRWLWHRLALARLNQAAALRSSVRAGGGQLSLGPIPGLEPELEKDWRAELLRDQQSVSRFRLLLQACRLVLAIEEARDRLGSYPTSWINRVGSYRVAYRKTDSSYSLRLSLWVPELQHDELLYLTSTGFRMSGVEEWNSWRI